MMGMGQRLASPMSLLLMPIATFTWDLGVWELGRPIEPWTFSFTCTGKYLSALCTGLDGQFAISAAKDYAFCCCFCCMAQRSRMSEGIRHSVKRCVASGRVVLHFYYVQSIVENNAAVAGLE
jgi:hypothetical protein